MAATAPRIIPMGYTPPTRPAAPKNQRFGVPRQPIDDCEKPDGVEIVVTLIIAVVVSLLCGGSMMAMRAWEPKEVVKAEVE